MSQAIRSYIKSLDKAIESYRTPDIKPVQALLEEGAVRSVFSQQKDVKRKLDQIVQAIERQEIGPEDVASQLELVKKLLRSQLE